MVCCIIPGLYLVLIEYTNVVETLISDDLTNVDTRCSAELLIQTLVMIY